MYNSYLVLITLTNNPQVSMPTLVDMLGERLTNSSWVVVMKALITTHNLITLGNEVRIQYILLYLSSSYNTCMYISCPASCLPVIIHLSSFCLFLSIFFPLFVISHTSTHTDTETLSFYSCSSIMFITQDLT